MATEMTESPELAGHPSPGEAPAPHHGPGEEHHPPDLLYVKVAAVLAVLTGLEVWTYFPPWNEIEGPIVPVMLIILMVLKFAGVVLFFMHLRFDSPLFSRIFVAGLITAVAVYLVTLTAFRFWQTGGI